MELEKSIIQAEKLRKSLMSRINQAAARLIEDSKIKSRNQITQAMNMKNLIKCRKETCGAQ